MENPYLPIPVKIDKVTIETEDRNLKTFKFVYVNPEDEKKVTNLYSKLIEGPYPDYSKVIPQNNSKFCIIDRNALQIAVRRVSVLSNQKTRLIKFTFSKNNLEILVSNREIGGEAREEIAVEYDNDNHTIGFNSQYLLEILEIIKTDKIKLEMNTQISGCLIFPCIDEKDDIKFNDLFLIMPLRILDEF